MNLFVLYQPHPPWFLIHDLSEEERHWTPAFLYGMSEYSPVIRVLRGRKMRTYQALMDEFGAALQFFEGFGENWPALRECLSEMDEWIPGRAYILIITHPEDLLSEEVEELPTFVRIIQKVGEWWQGPIVDNGRFNRPAIPFHVVLRCEESTSAQVRQKFSGAMLGSVNPPAAG